MSLKAFVLILFFFQATSNCVAQNDSTAVSGAADTIFRTVQVESKFEGGSEAWRNYLQRKLRVNTPVDNGAPPGRYTVVVSFIVDQEGRISEVRAENNPGFGTAQEAVRVIKTGPNWVPATQNGRKVKYRQRQSITFLVD